MEDIFANVSQTVLYGVHAAFDLIPDDAIAQNPPLMIGQFERNTPGNAEQVHTMLIASDRRRPEPAAGWLRPYAVSCRHFQRCSDVVVRVF